VFGSNLKPIYKLMGESDAAMVFAPSALTVCTMPLLSEHRSERVTKLTALRHWITIIQYPSVMLLHPSRSLAGEFGGLFELQQSRKSRSVNGPYRKQFSGRRYGTSKGV